MTGAAGVEAAVKIGVSGHRWRDGADWDWVRAKIEEIVAGTRNVVGYTSLASGADQIFAETILAHRRPLVAVVPYCRGRIELEDAERSAFDRLFARADKIVDVEGPTADEAFLTAGKYVADGVDKMVFVWDGEPARGKGGTADIVAYAAQKRISGIILDPITCTIRSL